MEASARGRGAADAKTSATIPTSNAAVKRRMSEGLQVLDDGFAIASRQVAAVEMTAVAVSAQRRIELHAALLRVGSARHESDAMPVVDVVAAIERGGTLVEEHQRAQRRDRPIVQIRRAEPHAIQRH